LSPSPENLDLARLYLRRAREDLTALRILVGHDDAANAVVGFHAQQAVEKLTKAVLASRDVEVPRTHDIRFLFELADSSDLDVPDEIREARWLTPWSVQFRYGDELTDELDRQAALSAAELVERWASSLVREEAGSDRS
jgi:HEPN domain-containing protein